MAKLLPVHLISFLRNKDVQSQVSVGKVWSSYHGSPASWMIFVQRGIVPVTVGYHKLLASYFKPFGFACYTKEKVCHTHIFHFLSIVAKRQHRGMNKGMDNLYNIKHSVSVQVW